MKLTTITKRLLPIAAIAALSLGLASCGSSGAYWGVDQQYPVGNGTMYYGAYGDTGQNHHFNQKEYKKYLKQQKKLRKQREKQMKRQYKQSHKKHHHHHN